MYNYHISRNNCLSVVNYLTLKRIIYYNNTIIQTARLKKEILKKFHFTCNIMLIILYNVQLWFCPENANFDLKNKINYILIRLVSIHGHSVILSVDSLPFTTDS